MPLRTPEEYRASLRDGHTVYNPGQRVDDVTTHPVIGTAVGHACIDYAMAVDALVGSAQLLADYNGIARAPHVRDKLIRLIAYAETLRALTHHAALRCSLRDGIAVPDALVVNMAKAHFAHGYHAAVQDVQDIAGGLLVTAPGAEDLASEELGPLLERYYGGRAGVGGRERLAAMHFVKELTSSDYGGYQEVLVIHAEGSLEAEKLMIARSYDSTRTLRLVKQMAGLE